MAYNERFIENLALEEQDPAAYYTECCVSFRQGCVIGKFCFRP